MAKEVIFLVEESPEGGYTTRALGEAIFTEGDSLEELREQVVDAVKATSAMVRIDNMPKL